jgi:hypothetical protein
MQTNKDSSMTSNDEPLYYMLGQVNQERDWDLPQAAFYRTSVTVFKKVIITFIMNDRIYDTLAEVISYTHRLIIQE